MYIEDLIVNTNIETDSVEFKGIIEEGKNDKGESKELSWISVIASFANTKGGQLYVGVDNSTHKIVSLDHKTVDKIVLMVHRLIKERISPKISYDIDALPIKENNDSLTRYVIKISVKRNKELPVMVKVGGLLGIYIRDFAVTREASSNEIINMVLYSNDSKYDQMSTNIKFDFADFKKLSEKFEENNERAITFKDIAAVGALDEEGNIKNGLLLFKDDFKNNEIKVICSLWPSSDKSTFRLLDTDEYQGNIIDAIDFAYKYVKSHSNNGYEKTSTGRIDYISYPERAVFEGIVNAFAHKNYLLKYSVVEINIFIDRLEIISPGNLIGSGTITKVKNLASIVPKIRNELISSILRILKMMEKRGSGFDVIVDSYNKYGDKYQPYISSNDEYFSLTLPDVTYTGLVEDTDFPDVFTNGMLNGKHDLKILSYCFNKPRTITQLASMLNLKPSTYFRTNVVDRLVSEGYLLASKKDGINVYMSNHKNVYIK